MCISVCVCVLAVYLFVVIMTHRRYSYAIKDYVLFVFKMYCTNVQNLYNTLHYILIRSSSCSSSSSSSSSRNSSNKKCIA